MEQAIIENKSLANGISVFKGYMVKKSLAEATGLPHANLMDKIKELNVQT
jgi:alanine dehydrogenase